MLYNIVIDNINYKNSKNFEEMITIYSNKNNKNDKNDKIEKYKKPIFVFIMGSAWMGHVPLLYYITNYWNSSIMKNLCNKGYTCVSLRHRGTFFRQINLSNKFNRILVVFLFLTNTILLINYLICVFAWNNICKHSSDFNTIKNDVELSLKYIDDNYKTIQEKYNGNGEIILAGYSSGVQVLNTCLISNNFKKYNNLKIKNIIYISGVLNLFENVDNNRLNNLTIINNVIYIFLLQLFSKFDIDNNLLVPYNTIDKLPKFEYYVLGCKNEFLNIPFIRNISKQIFCSKKFCSKLNNNFKSKYIEFNKNHWNILNSSKLCNTIQDIIEK